jgi:hypothetical protein
VEQIDIRATPARERKGVIDSRITVCRPIDRYDD